MSTGAKTGIGPMHALAARFPLDPHLLLKACVDRSVSARWLTTGAEE